MLKLKLVVFLVFLEQKKMLHLQHVIKHVLGGKSRLEKTSRKFDLCTLLLPKVLTNAGLGAIAAMMRVLSPISIQTEKTNASGSMSLVRCHAAVVECHFVDGRKTKGICLST